MDWSGMFGIKSRGQRDNEAERLQKISDEIDALTKAKTREPISETYATDKLSDLFNDITDDQVSPKDMAAFFAPAVKYVLEMLNAQDGLNAKAVSYYLSSRRDAPLKADLSAYADVKKVDFMKESWITNTKVLKLDVNVSHRLLQEKFAADGRLDQSTVKVTLHFIDDGKGDVRFAKGVDEKHDPNDAVDPFSEQAKAQILDQVIGALQNTYVQRLKAANERDALSVVHPTQKGTISTPHNHLKLG